MIAYAVIAHVARQTQAEALEGQLGYDDNVAQLFLDDGFLGEWRNHMRAYKWASRLNAISHVCVLQDDAILAPDFHESVEQAVRERPEDIISLYVGTSRPKTNVEEVREAVETAERVGASWLRDKTLHWGVGVIIPTALVAEMLDYCRRPPLIPYDQRLGRWAQETSRPVYYTWPSLVDHMDQPSVISGRSKEEAPRVAYKIGKPVVGGSVVDIL